MKKNYRAATLSLCRGLFPALLLALTVWAVGSEAAPSAQEPAPPPILDRALDRLPFLPGQPSAPALPEATPLTPLIPWSKVAFQSLRDGNWEIYYTDPDYYAIPLRVTTDPASDIHPRLNPGCTRIVFASKRTGSYEIFTTNPDGTGLTQLTFNGSDDVNPAWSPDGTRIAFQSYRDGQAEVYVMNADGSTQTRLTWDGAYDGEPAWSPDGSRLAFVSSRSGRYRIWVMNADGSSQTGLTNQPNCENPAWSPDGSRIAYDSDGDGDDWQELWLMNADGTNQQEIYDIGTSKDDTWAGSWSPDGRYLTYTKIHYVHYQGNWYWTDAYVYARDLENLSTWSLGGWGTEWNPDWQSMDPWAPTSSMTPLPGYSPAPFTVAWSGSDMGPSGLLGYDIQVKDGDGGNWSDWQTETTGVSALYPGIGGHKYYFRCRAKDGAGHIEPWPADYDAYTIVESSPPHTAVNPLPTYFRNGQIIRWGGTDPGGSAIQSYDVQYRNMTGGSWTDWQVAAINTYADFSGTAGQTYAFRCRAIDSAQNVEPWPAGNGDTSTTLYTWGVSGHVRDNADAAVTGASITTVPGAFHSVASGMDGAYAAYVLDSATSYTVAWNKAKYGDLPSTEFNALQDAQVEVILPPADNVVLNWGFENGSLGPGDWLPGGEMPPVVTDTLQHTGQYAALLGHRATGFAPPLNISNTPLVQDYRPQIAVDAAGTVHVIWSHNTGLYYAQRSQDSAWSSPEDISYNNGETTLPRLIVDSSGVVHVAWTERISGCEQICYTQRTTNGIWSPPQMVSNSSAAAWLGDMAVGGQGVVHVAWSWSGGTERFYARRSLDGLWSDPVQFAPGHQWAEEQLVAETGGAIHAVLGDYDHIYYVRSPGDGTWSAPYLISPGTYGQEPRLAIAPDGSLHVVLREEVSEGENPYYQVFYTHSEGDGVWFALERLSNSPDDKYGLQLAVDSAGVAHVVWYTHDFYNHGSIYYARRGVDGTWSGPEDISRSLDRGRGPQLATDRQGTVHVAWLEAEPLEEVYYAQKARDGAWTSPQRISNDPSGCWDVRLAVDDKAHSHIVWTDSDIYYAGPAFAEQTGDSSIAQAVVVPVSPATPVLSFLYQLGGAYPVNNTWFSVQVDNGITATTLLSTSTNTDDWTHRWFDLSPWAGQTVTLTFNVHETAGRPVAWAYLDEVTLGSAYPDVWVGKNPVAALPGEPAVFTLSYGNRGGAAAHSVRLTDTLPAELTFVAASPPPLTTTPALVWEVGDLAAKSEPFAIVVTVTVAPGTPLLTTLTNVARIGAASPELETANNQATATVFVGRRTYLPLVFKMW